MALSRGFCAGAKGGRRSANDWVESVTHLDNAVSAGSVMSTCKGQKQYWQGMVTIGALPEYAWERVLGEVPNESETYRLKSGRAGCIRVDVGKGGALT